MSAEQAVPHLAPLPADYATNPAAAEERVLAGWREQGTFAAVQAARADGAAFVFWEGPPTANGRPGIHHVLARTLKDSVCRWQTMQGRRVERKAGWDTHGLPVELEVEKQLGISGKPAIEGLGLDPATGLAGIARFNDACRKSVWKYKDEWERLSERIGFWLDYADPYVTYDPKYVDSVWFLLAKMHAAGLVYRGQRVLPYCGRCGTSLSSHELGQPGVYKDVNDPSVIVRFVLRDMPGQRPRSIRESLLAWTTTPWTLPSNFALAVNGAVGYGRYGLIHKDGSREIVWLAIDRRADVLSEAGFKSPYPLHLSPGQSFADPTVGRPGDHFELDTKLGHELAALEYVPLFRVEGADLLPVTYHRDAKRFIVVGGSFVTTTEGTGIVHQAPYGADDWDTANRESIATVMAVGRDGRFSVDVQTWTDIKPPPTNRTGVVIEPGVWFKDSDKQVLKDLRSRRLLFDERQAPHSYPHCWRCSSPLYYFPTPAWFIRTTELKQRMLELNSRVNWVPAEVGTSRFGEWLENNVDWNISRDRYWGTPLPFWECSEFNSVEDESQNGCDHTLAVGGVDQLRALAGTLPADFDHHKPSVDAVTIPCPKCGKTMRRTSAVLDCWFDSGAMPYAQHGWPHVPGSDAKLRDQFPAAFICEGLDQTRGWFYTLHAIGAFMTQAEPSLGDRPAYGTCMVNGLVLDKDGVKMSKRLGNVVNPWDAIGTHGVDAIRWYLVASGSPWLPKRFDSEALAEVRRGFFGTLYNSYKFFQEYARIDRFDAQDARVPALAARPEIDRWLVSRTHSLVAEVRRRFDAFDFAGGARAIEVFVVDELSNWYIRRNRRRFWRGEAGADKLAAFATLHFALRTTALLIAPLAPFLAELLWQRLEPLAGSVHAQLAPCDDARELTPELEASMEVVQRIVVMGRALREKAGLKVRQPLRALHVRSSDPRSLALLATRFASELVLDELNVKAWGSLAADDGHLCRLSAKANFRTLGKRLGARMKAVAARIDALDAASLAALRAGASVTIELDGESLEIRPDDVLIQVESSATFDVETDGRFVVWLDTGLDAELVAEGLARETVNRVNGLRKETGLAVEDRIRLVLAPEDDTLRRALEQHAGFIAGETLALELSFSASGGLTGDCGRWDLGGEHFLCARLARA